MNLRRLLLPKSVRDLDDDLVVVLLLAGLTDLLVVLPFFDESPLRAVLGLCFLLIGPGYAVVSALFPHRDRPLDGADVDEHGNHLRQGTTSGITSVERILFSVGISIFVVVAINLALVVSEVGIRIYPLIVSMSLVTVIATILAAVRRQRLPDELRFTFSFEKWSERLRTARHELKSGDDLATNVVLAISVVLLVGSLVFVSTVPSPDQRYTEFYLLTGNESSSPEAADFPANFTLGEGRPIIIGIENHEGRVMTYETVIELQRVSKSGGETEVQATQELGQFNPRLGPGETLQRNFVITPRLVGSRLRLVFSLYRGSTPTEPSRAEAYRSLHLWVNVSSENGTVPQSGSGGSDVPPRRLALPE